MVQRVGQRLRSLVERAKAEASWQQWLLVLIAVFSAAAMHYALQPNSTTDFSGGMELWLQTLRDEGFAAFGTTFANYNPPFLYLLYLGTLTGFSDLSIVKLIAFVFDIVMAAGVAAIVYQLRRGLLLAVFAGVGVLFLPEVFLNSAMWGQADSVFTAFLVWSAYFVITRRFTPAWVLFALAFSIKLQGMFFLPWIALAFIVQKHRWRSVLWALLAFALTYVPSLIAGRSLSSLASIYVDQANTQKILAVVVSNMYQWIPQAFYPTVFPAGLAFALGLVALLSALYLSRAKSIEFPERWLLQVAAAIGVLVPFVLPEMHDRYFYPGAIFATICILIDRRYIAPAILLQFTAVLTYSAFLFDDRVFPLPIVAVPQLVAVLWIVWLSVSHINRRPLARFDEVPGELPAKSSAPL